MNHRGHITRYVDLLKRWCCMTSLLILGSTISLIGCSGGMIHRVDTLPIPPHNGGFLRIKGGNPSTLIYLNGSFKGALKSYPRRTLLIKRGRHRLELRLPGFASTYHLIEIKDTKPTEVDALLIALPADPPVPQH